MQKSQKLRKEVCVQPFMLTVNVTLLAFAAGRPPLSIDISCLWRVQQQICRTLPQRSIDGTDRQTDGHPTVT